MTSNAAPTGRPERDDSTDSRGNAQSSPGMGRAGTFGTRVGLIAGAGLVVRLLYVFHIGRDIPIAGDPRFYHRAGRLLAAGEGYIRPGAFEATGEKLPTAWFPPGFPSVLAALDGLGLDTVTGQRVFTAGLGTATVIVIGLIGRQVAGPVVGLLGAGVAAVAPMLVVADGSLGVETLYGLIVALVVLLVCRLARPDQPPSWSRWAALGAVVAAAAYVRGEGVLLLVFLVVPLAFRWPGSWRVRLTRLGVATGALVLVLAPWTIRNYVAFDGVVLISNSGNGTIGRANCGPTYYAPALRGGHLNTCWPDRTLDAGDTVGVDSELDERRFSSLSRERGLTFARQHLSAVPSTVAVRVLRTWGLHEPSEQIRLEAFLESRDRGWLQWGHRLHLALMAMAVVGSGVALRERLRAWPLWSLIAMVTLTSALSYGNQRFRFAAEFALIVLAALGLVYLWRAARARSWKVTVVGEGPPGPRAPPRVRRAALTAVGAVAAFALLTPVVASPQLWAEGAVVDTFDRDAPGPSLGPADSLQTWRTVGGVWAVEDRAAGVVEAPERGAPLAVLNTAMADVRVAVTLTDIEPGSGLVFRYENVFNHWAVKAQPNFATWSVEKVVDGTVTSVGTVGRLTFDQEETRLEVSVFRDRIQFFVNGRPASTYFDLTHADATVAGLIGAATAGPGQTRWRDFEATPEGNRTR